MSGELPDELDVDLGDDADAGEDGDAGATDLLEDSPLDVDEPQEETERITVFRLGGQAYGAPVMEVEEVVRTSPLTRVPRTAEAVDGVVDIRGDITVVVNPWVHLALTADPEPWDRQFIVAFQTDDDQQSVGVRIDRIVGVEPIPVSDVDHDDPSNAPSGASPLVEGVARREDGDDVGLIDIDAVIAVAGQHPHVGRDRPTDADLAADD